MKIVTVSLVSLLAASSLAVLLDDRAFINEDEYKDYAPDMKGDYMQNDMFYENPEDPFMQQSFQSFRQFNQHEVPSRRSRGSFNIQDKVFSLLGLPQNVKDADLSFEEDKQNPTIDDLKDEKHNIKMGIPADFCDDAKTNLEVDWNMSPVNYTCYLSRRYPVNPEVKSRLECEAVPKGFMPQHYCMDKKITYNRRIPTFGNHRPLWPVFGEYQFTPPQRWLHSIEHGAIVMLYHPCAQPMEVGQLRKIVKDCIRKHVITSYTLLEPDRPLALVAWGCRFLMSVVDKEEVREFIKRHALKGPEGKYAKQGQYNLKLLQQAVPPQGSDYHDSVLCPSRRKRV